MRVRLRLLYGNNLTKTLYKKSKYQYLAKNISKLDKENKDKKKGKQK